MFLGSQNPPEVPKIKARGALTCPYGKGGKPVLGRGKDRSTEGGAGVSTGEKMYLREKDCRYSKRKECRSVPKRPQGAKPHECPGRPPRPLPRSASLKKGGKTGAGADGTWSLDFLRRAAFPRTVQIGVRSAEMYYRRGEKPTK